MKGILRHPGSRCALAIGVLVAATVAASIWPVSRTTLDLQPFAGRLPERFQLLAAAHKQRLREHPDRPIVRIRLGQSPVEPIILPNGQLDAVPPRSETSPTIVGDYALRLCDLHYCGIGQRCVSGGTLVIASRDGKTVHQVTLGHMGTEAPFAAEPRDDEFPLAQLHDVRKQLPGAEAPKPAELLDLLRRFYAGESVQERLNLQVARLYLLRGVPL